MKFITGHILAAGRFVAAGRLLSEISVRVMAGILLILMVLAYSKYQAFGRPFDDTDRPPQRSGLRVFTDYGTHCQYVSSDNGGLTLRRDADGDAMCGEINPPATQ